MNKLVIFGLIVASAMAVPVQEVNPHNLDCMALDDSVISCLTLKANSLISRAARSNDIQIIPGVTFVRDAPMERSGKLLIPAEADLLAALPQESSERALKLLSMIYDSVVAFFKSHTLKIDADEKPLARALTEGRAKFKKMILPLLTAGALKIFTIGPILLGGLGLLVLKALLVGKTALLLGAVLLFQRLFNSGAGIPSVFKQNPQPAASSWYDSNAGTQGWSTGGAQGQQGYYKRSFDDVKIAQNLAYSAHAPSESE